MIISGNFLVYNDIINCEIKCEKNSEKRDEMMKKVEETNKHEKYKKSYLQKMIDDFYRVDVDE